jgi:hypothetical protein
VTRAARRTRAVAVSCVSALFGALLASCSSGPTPHARPGIRGPAATFDSNSIRHTVLLIGDAGAVRRDDPLLIALRRMADEAPARTLVVFLGDNLYEAGLPSGEGPDVERLKDVLRAQLRAAGSARALFVAGNHDWNEYRKVRKAWTEGRAALRRQAAFIAREGHGRAMLLPAAGCAGPAEFPFADARDALRVIAIDSQWWLTALAVPPPRTDGAAPDAGCTAGTTEDAARELARMLTADPERPTIVVAHHPLASNGKHGHPILGWPFNVQDIPNRRNARFRTLLANALDSTRVVLYASGHDHDLELFSGPGARFTLVSGAGSDAKIGRFKGRRGSPLARDTGPGFARVDVLHGGRIALRLVSVREGDARIRACLWMAPESLAGQSCDASASPATR